MIDRRGSVRVVLIDEDGSELDPHEPPTPSDGGAWIGDHVERARGFRATTGNRLGPAAVAPIRRGSNEEVVTPLAISPFLSLTDTVTERALADPAAGLTVESSPAVTRAGGDTAPRSWPAQLRTGPLGRRAATLRLRPSPSLNLTIIELVPTRAPWFRSKAFIRAGVPAIAELATRIRDAAMVTESAKTPTGTGKSTNRA